MEIDEKIQKDYYHLLESVKDYLYYCQNIGITNLPGSSHSDFSSLFGQSSFSTLTQLQNHLTNCRHCSLNLKEGTKAQRHKGTEAETPHKKNENPCSLNSKAVGGAGNSSPILVIIGYAPTSEESVQGKPFLGERGELLTKILSSIKIARNNVYLTYCIKCPLQEKEHFSSMTRNCRTILFQELGLLNPEIICTLGRKATKFILQTETPFEDIRGKVIPFTTNNKAIKVIPTFSPDHLLQHPKDKNLTWLDIQLIRSEYDKA